MKDYYQLSAEEVLKLLKSSVSGLNNDVVATLLKQYGPNALEEPIRKSRLAIFFDQFKDLMIVILIAAAIISFIVRENTDAFVILAIVIANAWMGFSQASKAEKSISMLKKMAKQHALVLRGNTFIKVEASTLVPGDIIILEAGDIVPSDARLLEASALKTDESSLTGESNPVDKSIEAIQTDNLMVADQVNMVFKATMVSSGTAKAVVTTTGMKTQIGKIAGLLDTPPSQTPLQKRLAAFSRQLVFAVIITCILVFVYGKFRKEPTLQMFLTALSLAVAALPEALPAVITIALARGARRMVRQNALIRKLPAVETLGSVTYICTDKTGTLTQNVMSVEKTYVFPGKEELFGYALMLNNQIRFSKKKLLGDSTEIALVNHALKNLSKDDADEKFQFIDRMPFDSGRMRMGTLHKTGDQWILFVKGAPAKIVEILSPRYKDEIEGWLTVNRQWAAEGMRVLFFAYRIFDKEPLVELSLENDLDFLGIAAMIDPPREEVMEAIRQCKSAGIKPVMITGDQKLTAKAIAERLDIFGEGSDKILTGTDLNDISDEQLRSEVKSVSVYARVSPEQKLKIVSALQSNGEFVAMTGDGVNDAPSLKQSDIGLAMGITGTDVAKEASDMILLDDNFATIVKAIKEGRRIYENIRKFILYVLSGNLGEILTILLAPAFGFAVPLLPIHILWINLVTDGLPGIALIAEPAEKNIMNLPPRSPKEHLFAGGMLKRIILSAIIMTMASLFIQWWAIRNGYDLRAQQSMVFSTLCFVQLGNALAVRSSFRSMFSKDIFFNRSLWIAITLTVILQILLLFVPVLQTVFKTVSPDFYAVLTVLAVVISSTILIDMLKIRKSVNG